jgi:NOL1/NOP2/sun family putative RNA methylase
MEEKEFLSWLSSYTDADAAFASLQQVLPSFRINTLKISPTVFDSISRLQTTTPVWNPLARVLTKQEKTNLGKSFEYFLGYIHPQSLSSMIPPLVLDPKPGEQILDLTAAPGSKTTQISALMENKGMLVANDSPDREIFIVNNLARLGAINVVVTNRDAKAWPLKNEFDRVLLDAPCSALGSNLNAIRRFSPEAIAPLVAAQRRMIISAFDAVKPGGTLVYSTCTYTEDENEGALRHLFELRPEAKLEKIKPAGISSASIPHSAGLEECKDAWRIYPQEMGSEGFFVAKIKKVYE